MKTHTPKKEKMGSLSKILGLITEPERVFLYCKENPDFFIPILFILLSVMAGVYISDFTQTLMVEQYPQLPPAESTAPQWMSLVTGTIVAMVFWVIKTLLHYGLAILLGGEGGFKETLSIFGYTYFATTLQSIVSTMTLLFMGTPVTLGLGLLLPVTHQFFTLRGMILSSINIFEIFFIVLTLIGLSTAMGISRRKSLFITLLFWVIGHGITIGFAMISFRLLEHL